MKLILILFFSCFSLSIYAQESINIHPSSCWLFVNHNNHLHLNLGKISFDKISIKAPGCAISNLRSDGFTIKPRRRGNATIKVYRNSGGEATLLWEGTFLVKELPAPTAFIRSLNTRKLSKNEFLIQKGINVSLLNYGISVSFPIESYTLIITRDKELVLLKEFEGGLFTSEMMDDLRKLLKGGERLFFTNIKIKSLFHENKIVNSIELSI